MTKTVPIQYGDDDDRFIWAYDVSFGILLFEAISVATERSQPEGFAEVLAKLRAHAQIGGSASFMLDDDAWSGPQRTLVHELIAEAGHRLRRRGRMTRAEAEARYVAGNEPFSLRFEKYVDGPVVAELAEAMERLLHGDLPPAPTAGQHWLYGLESGPRTI